MRRASHGAGARVRTSGIDVALSEKIFQRISEYGGRVSVKSALNPILWLCGIISFPLLSVAAYQGNPSLWLIVIGAAPVGVAIVGYLFLLLFDRDRLQSEDYQLRKQSLELIQEKGQPFPISAPSIESISNPRHTIRLPGDKNPLEGEE